MTVMLVLKNLKASLVKFKFLYFVDSKKYKNNKLLFVSIFSPCFFFLPSKKAGRNSLPNLECPVAGKCIKKENSFAIQLFLRMEITVQALSKTVQGTPEEVKRGD